MSIGAGRIRIHLTTCVLGRRKNEQSTELRVETESRCGAGEEVIRFRTTKTENSEHTIYGSGEGGVESYDAWP